MILNMLKSTSMADVGNTDVTNVRIVNELIELYATDRVLHEATEEVATLKQGAQQKAHRFHSRLISKANCLGYVFSAHDLLSFFMRGIDDSIISRAATIRRPCREVPRKEDNSNGIPSYYHDT